VGRECDWEPTQPISINEKSQIRLKRIRRRKTTGRRKRERNGQVDPEGDWGYLMGGSVSNKGNPSRLGGEQRGRAYATRQKKRREVWLSTTVKNVGA